MSYSLYLGISTIVSAYILTLFYLYPIKVAKIFYGLIGLFYGLISGIIIDLYLEIFVFSFVIPIISTIYAYQIKKLLIASFFLILLTLLSYSILAYLISHTIYTFLFSFIISLYVSHKIYDYYDLLVIYSIGVFVGTHLHQLHFNKIPFIDFLGNTIYSIDSIKNPFILIGELRTAILVYYTYLVEFQFSKILLVIVTITASLIYSRSKLSTFNNSKKFILGLLHLCLIISIISLFIDNYYWSVIFALGYNFSLLPILIIVIYTFLKFLKSLDINSFYSTQSEKLNISMSFVISLLIFPFIGYTFFSLILMKDNQFFDYLLNFKSLPIYLYPIKAIIVFMLTYLVYNLMLNLKSKKDHENEY